METPYNPQPTEENLLEEFEVNLQQASTGKRFANMLIDFVVYYLLSAIYGVFQVLFFPELLDREAGLGNFSLSRLWPVYCIYLLYYIVSEFAFKGKTLGKLITRTRAVREDGGRITLKMALLRSLSRIVPFEAFSALGSPPNPWHDTWTHTYVIDEKASTMPAGA